MPSTRTVQFRRYVGGAVPAWQALDIDLQGLSLAAVEETALSGTGVSAWRLFFDELLDPTEFRWADDGPGIGVEMKRGFSAIMGRFVARWYLTSCEGITDLMPLDVSGTVLRHGFAVRRTPGEPGNLPDWVGTTASHWVIAEAKGSHEKSNWESRIWPAPLETALKQVERAQVVRRRSRRATVFRAKRWAVASQWATENNGQVPRIIAHDPISPGQELPGPEWERVRKMMRQVRLRRLYDGLGFSRIASFGHAIRRSSSLESYFAVRVDDRFIDKGFVAAIGPFGSVPLRSPNALENLRTSEFASEAIALVMISGAEIREAFSAGAGQRREMRQEDEFISREGLTLLPFNPDRTGTASWV